MGWFSNLLRPELIATPKTRQELFRFYAGRSLTRATEAQRTQCRAQLHDLFASKTWSQLDYDTKCQAVQALEQDFAYQQHRPPKQVIPTKTPYFGYWSPQDNAIHINTDLLSQGKLSNSLWENPMPDANFQVFDTIAHEGYHAYQSYALQHPNIHADKAQLRQWALNQGKYYPDGNRYYIQPTERDAWKYGHNATTEAFAGIEARNGPEPADSKQEYLDHAQACSYDNRLAQEQLHSPNVLQMMDLEMEAGCLERGIRYDFGSKAKRHMIPESVGIPIDSAAEHPSQHQPPGQALSQDDSQEMRQGDVQQLSDKPSMDLEPREPEQLQNPPQEEAMEAPALQEAEQGQAQLSEQSMDDLAPQETEQLQPQQREQSMDDLAPQETEQLQPQQREQSMDDLAPQEAEQSQPQQHEQSMDDLAPQETEQLQPQQREQSMDDLAPQEAEQSQPQQREQSMDDLAPLEAPPEKTQAESQEAEAQENDPSEDNTQTYGY